MRSISAAFWKRSELFLCLGFVLCRCINTFLTFGRGVGFDTSKHIQYMNVLGWDFLTLPVKKGFYSYHPPLSFFAAKAVSSLGFTNVQSVQILNAICSLATFFLLRWLLSHLRLLERMEGVVFLYVTVALPIQTYLSRSVNMESVLLLFGTLTATCSVLLFSPVRPPRTQLIKRWCIVGICLGITGSLLTKFSGIVTLAIPPFAALGGPKSNRARSLKTALLILCASVALASPYYLIRNVGQTGILFPDNMQWIFSKVKMAEAVRIRDEDPVGFFLQMLAPSPAHREGGIVRTDPKHMRLMDAWRDVWLKKKHLGAQPVLGFRIGVTELWIFLFVVLYGCMHWLFSKKPDNSWRMLSRLCVGTGSVALLAFFAYLYRTATPLWGPAKAIYACFSFWTIGFLVAEASSGIAETRVCGTYWVRALPWLLALYVLVNTLVLRY